MSSNVIEIPSVKKVASMNDTQETNYLKKMVTFIMENAPEQVKMNIGTAAEEALKYGNKEALKKIIADYAPMAFESALSLLLWNMSDKYVGKTPGIYQYQFADDFERMKGLTDGEGYKGPAGAIKKKKKKRKNLFTQKKRRVVLDMNTNMTKSKKSKKKKPKKKVAKLTKKVPVRRKKRKSKEKSIFDLSEIFSN